MPQQGMTDRSRLRKRPLETDATTNARAAGEIDIAGGATTKWRSRHFRQWDQQSKRGVRISRTNALRKLVHSTASACSSEYGRHSFGGSNGVRSLIWLKASQVRRRPAQLRLHNIRRQ